ncbi:MAG TPA: hypothetical protein VGU20_17190 [Stellaceae bacterium]|nr:hypothetical protein [Stellaceae bacterium]
MSSHEPRLVRVLIGGASALLATVASAASAADDPLSNSAGHQGAVGADLAGLAERVRRAQATQPDWSSPLVTTTGMLEQRLRFDLAHQHAGNATDTTVIDGGRGLDLIVSETNEVQIAAIPYDIRTGPAGKGALAGFADWPFLRVKQRLASSPASDGNYVLTTWLQVQAPAGVAALSNNAWTFLPTLAFGKGCGSFDVQGTIGGVLPVAHTDKLGQQIVTNVALQYHALGVLWPQLEVNWTHFVGGQRHGLNQIFLTPGLVVGRFHIADVGRLTVGVGYQSAVAPPFRATPLTPAFDHAWLFSSRLNF